MPRPELPPLFAGHSDFLNALAGFDQKALLTGTPPGAPPTPDLARRDGLVAGLYEVLVPPSPPSRLIRTPGGIEVEYPPRLDLGTALGEVVRGLSLMRRVADSAGSPVRIVTSVDDLAAAIHDARIAVVLHLADADCLDPELHTLDVLHDAGVRSLAITWSRQNRFGYGVPYQAPGHPDTGPGLTAAGHALVSRCNDLGIIVDLAHLNLAGFDDVATTSNRPLVVTHGAAHALSPTSRALTDDQLRTVAASDGIVGVSLEGVPPSDRGIVADLVAQLTYLLDLIGPRHVALGSDLYRPPTAEHPGGRTHIPELLLALSETGLGVDNLHALAHRNWQRVLEASWVL